MPEFAPGWHELSMFIKDFKERLEIIEIGLSKNPDVTTKMYLTLNKASALNESGEKESAIKLVYDLIDQSDNNLLAFGLGHVLIRKFRNTDYEMERQAFMN